MDFWVDGIVSGNVASDGPIADAASRQTEYGEVVRQFEYIFGITYVSDLFTVISPDAEHGRRSFRQVLHGLSGLRHIHCSSVYMDDLQVGKVFGYFILYIFHLAEAGIGIVADDGDVLRLRE